MKNFYKKVLFLLCLLLITAFAGCKEKAIYAENSDFQSYPDYWNSFNQNSNGDVYIPNGKDNTTTEAANTSESTSGSNTGTDNKSSADTSSDDWTANFGSDDMTDNSSTSGDNNSSADNSGSDNGDTSKDNSSGNQGPLVFFK